MRGLREVRTEVVLEREREVRRKEGGRSARDSFISLLPAAGTTACGRRRRKMVEGEQRERDREDEGREREVKCVCKCRRFCKEGGEGHVWLGEIRVVYDNL